LKLAGEVSCGCPAEDGHDQVSHVQARAQGWRAKILQRVQPWLRQETGPGHTRVTG